MAGTRILCPVDFSDNSLAALETALTLARAQEGSLHLLHVVEPNSPMSAGQLTGPFTDLDMRELEGRLKDSAIKEVIVALGTDVEGDATSHYLSTHLAREGLRITRIAHGLPAGAGLELADQLTLARALEGRREL